MKRFLLLPFAIVITVGCVPDEGPETARRPNIIYILADDLGYGDLSVQGQQHFKTPNIDRLASEGVRFTQHYSGSTVCAPSRDALLTGRHTGHTFVRGNKPVQPEGQTPIPAETVTVAEILAEAGYRTGAAGKWGLGAPDTEGLPTRQGFDFFYGYNCQREAHSYYPDHLWRNEERVPLDGKTYAHDLITEEALGFIRRNQDAPFFLFVPYTIPHAGLDVPEDSMAPFVDSFDESPFAGRDRYVAQARPKAAYAGMVTRLDRDVGRILELIAELGLDENTVVMFSSDNGPHLEGGAEPDFFDSNGPFRGYKRDLYEGGVRVPLLVRWSGTIDAGRTSEHVSAFWDVLPTLAELAGAPVPDGLDGISFVPELTNAPQDEHDYLYWEFHEQGGKQAVRMKNWKGVRVELETDPEGPIELYDLEADPGETTNVAAEHPELVTEIAAIMESAHEPSEVFPFPGDEP
jgi:arylsulfatase A-like enzyme